MELDNQTEEQYKKVRESLEAINIKVPTGVAIMENIVAICEGIADGNTSKETVTIHSLGCGAESFSSIFKKTTGVSILDIPKMTAFDKRRRDLRKLEYSEDQIKEIIKIVDKTEE